MHIDDAIKGRRSIRRYSDREIADLVLHELIDLARHAPSSLDGQPWHFVIVKDQSTKMQLIGIKEDHCPVNKRHYPPAFLAICACCYDYLCRSKNLIRPRSRERDARDGHHHGGRARAESRERLHDGLCEP